MDGLCECGCGEPAPIAEYTERRHGWVKGQPKRYKKGHHTRRPDLRAKIARSWIERPADAKVATRARMSEAKQGAKNPRWKGDEVGYDAVHRWLRKNYSKTGHCEECGEKQRTEWANVSGEYRRARADFRELCKSCHTKFDRARIRAAVEELRQIAMQIEAQEDYAADDLARDLMSVHRRIVPVTVRPVTLLATQSG